MPANQPITRADLDQLKAEILSAIHHLESKLIPADPETLSDAGREALRQALVDSSPTIPHDQILREFGR